MGSIAFSGEDESQPITSDGKKDKLTTMLVDGSSAVNQAAVPRKLRSAIKKRGRESITSPLPISRKLHRGLRGVDALRKDGAKKSKLKMKRGHITKDEEEVAETLYALAGMFSDAKKYDQPGLDYKQPEAKSSDIKVGSISAAEDIYLTLQEESRKISSKVTLEAACHSSNLGDSTIKDVNFQSLAAQHHEFSSSKQLSTSRAFGVQSDLSLGSRPSVLTGGITPSCEHEINLELVPASQVQYDNNYNPMNDKHKGSLLLPNLSATGALSSEMQISCPSARLPALSGSTIISSQLRVIDNSDNTEKYNQIAVEPEMSWKRCSAHVYISRLIKILQISDRKEGLLEKPTQLSGGTELQRHLSNHNKMTGVNGINHGASSSGINSASQKDSTEMQNDILLHKSPIKDQEMASGTYGLYSAKQGYDFLSLGSGVCGLDASERVSRAGHSHEPPKQCHTSYLQSQKNSAMLFSLPQNDYFSTFHNHNPALAAQQVQLPQYHSSSFTGQTGQQLEAQQQNWAAHLHTHYNTGGDLKIGRESASVLNYAHTLFPHLHATPGSKYQQFSPLHQQVMAMNLSLPPSKMKRHHQHLPLGFERNGATFHLENMLQLQLPCNQHP